MAWLLKLGLVILIKLIIFSFFKFIFKSKQLFVKSIVLESGRKFAKIICLMSSCSYHFSFFEFQTANKVLVRIHFCQVSNLEKPLTIIFACLRRMDLVTRWARWEVCLLIVLLYFYQLRTLWRFLRFKSSIRTELQLLQLILAWTGHESTLHSKQSSSSFLLLLCV